MRHATWHLDERLLLLAGEAAEAVEAFARAIAVIETAVGALGELGEVAKVGVVVHLGHGVTGGAGDAARDGEGAGATLVDVNLHEVLHAGLAGLVGELDGEVHLVCAEAKLVGGLAEVGGHLGVLERAIGGLGVAAEVLNAIVEASAERDGAGGTSLDRDALEDLVGKGAEGVLHAGSSDDVGGTGDDAVSAPDAAIGVVVHHEELSRLRASVAKALSSSWPIWTTCFIMEDLTVVSGSSPWGETRCEQSGSSPC